MVGLIASFWLHDIFHPLSGSGYQFWSGIGSDVTEIALIGWLYAFLRRHNCSTRGCWRIGRHPVSGTTYVVCRKHHPDDKPTAEQITAEHEDSSAVDLGALQLRYEKTIEKEEQAFSKLVSAIDELNRRLDSLVPTKPPRRKTK